MGSPVLASHNAAKGLRGKLTARYFPFGLHAASFPRSRSGRDKRARNLPVANSHSEGPPAASSRSPDGSKATPPLVPFGNLRTCPVVTSTTRTGSQPPTTRNLLSGVKASWQSSHLA